MFGDWKRVLFKEIEKHRFIWEKPLQICMEMMYNNYKFLEKGEDWNECEKNNGRRKS